MFAKYYDRVTANYDALMMEEKRTLLAGLRGRVVEIGPGTGSNLALMPEGITWIGIEPNEHMHPLIRAKADGLGKEVDLRLLPAGKLPLEDNSVDAVLSILVLCSVPDVSEALGEIHRVLKPGGQFVFWEHVIAPRGALRRGLHHVLTPMQRAMADGCRCNRDFAQFLRDSPFELVDLREFEIPKAAGPPWIRPHVAGVALRSE